MTFFIDANIDGPSLVDPLRAAGLHIELHRDHFERNEDDTVWIPEAAKRGWIAVTNDKNTKAKDAEVLAIVRSNARMLYIKKKEGVSMEAIAANFINTLDQVHKFFERHAPPCAASLLRPNKVEELEQKKPGRVQQRQLKLPKHLRHLGSTSE